MGQEKKSPEIDLHKYSQVIFDKRAKKIQNRKGNLFNKLCWDNWTTTYQKNDIYFKFINKY